jgi:hypothetical protein
LEYAQTSFNKNFIPVLLNEYEHYGLLPSDNIQAALLEDAIPYYEINANHLRDIKSNKDKLSLDKLFKFNGKYICPIKVGDKSAGVAFVEKVNGNWEVISIASYLSFKNDMSNNLNLVSSEDKQKAKLVFDERFRISGIIKADTVNEGSIIPIFDNKDMSYNKNIPISISEKNIDKMINYDELISATGQDDVVSQTN